MFCLFARSPAMENNLVCVRFGSGWVALSLSRRGCVAEGLSRRSKVMEGRKEGRTGQDKETLKRHL